MSNWFSNTLDVFLQPVKEKRSRLQFPMNVDLDSPSAKMVGVLRHHSFVMELQIVMMGQMKIHGFVKVILHRKQSMDTLIAKYEC